MFIITVLLTGEGSRAVLSFSAAPTVVVDNVKLPLSRRFPTLGEKLAAFFSPNPDTTQALLLCVVSEMLRLVPDPVFVAVNPSVPTPEYSATSIRLFTEAERLAVTEVEAATPWAAHISTRALVPLLIAPIKVYVDPPVSVTDVTAGVVLAKATTTMMS